MDNNLYNGLTGEAIAFWSMIGTWAASITTISAVLVSLYMSWTKNKPNIKCSAIEEENRNGLGVALGGVDPKVIRIQITNIIEVSVNIKSLHIANKDIFPFSIFNRMKSKSIHKSLDIRSSDVSEDLLPKMLSIGEEANFIFRTDKAWYQDLYNDLKELNLNPNKFVFAAVLTTGHVFYIRPDKVIMDRLLNSQQTN